MVRRLEDLVAYQFAETFADEVQKLIDASPGAARSWKFRDQLQDAASGVARAIAEGFGRFRPTEFAQFLRYALASLAESTSSLNDGIRRGYFTDADAEPASVWARRCKEVTIKLLVSQVRRSRADRELKKPQAHPPMSNRANQTGRNRRQRD